MCQDRGYILSDTKNDSYTAKDANENLVFVKLISDNAGIKCVNSCINEAVKIQAKRLILIAYKFTPKAKRLADIANIDVELFTMAELSFNITKHPLVPKYTVLTDEEKKALIFRYRILESNIPLIYKSDPVAKYFGLAEGQVRHFKCHLSSNYLLLAGCQDRVDRDNLS